MTGRTGEMVPLRAVLANAARELEAIAARANNLDEAVGDMLANVGDGGCPPLALLQDVDVLRQSVDCMRILIGNLARQDLGGCGISRDAAVEGVYLEAIRNGCLKRHG